MSTGAAVDAERWPQRLIIAPKPISQARNAVSGRSRWKDSRLIPNGVHVASFKPVRSAVALPYPFILAMAVQPQRKLDVLLRAFTSVALKDPLFPGTGRAGKELTAYTA